MRSRNYKTSQKLSIFRCRRDMEQIMLAKLCRGLCDWETTYLSLPFHWKEKRNGRKPRDFCFIIVEPTWWSKATYRMKIKRSNYNDNRNNFPFNFTNFPLNFYRVAFSMRTENFQSNSYVVFDRYQGNFIIDDTWTTKVFKYRLL